MAWQTLNLLSSMFCFHERGVAPPLTSNEKNKES